MLERYRWRHEAEMACGVLEDAGIPAAVSADDAGGMLAAGGLPSGRLPVRLLVRRADEARAREALSNES